MTERTLSNKIIAAYTHGRMDFLAGAPCKAETPLIVYRDLTEKQKIQVSLSWIGGWNDQMNESLMQSLPDGSPA